MSRIEDALRKIQRQPPSSSAGSASRIGTSRSAIPLAARKKVVIDGPKHHVSQRDLIEGGLLAPLDNTMPIADEFRRIKRPLIANASAEIPGKAGAPMNVIMITSAFPGAGKTFCSVNLAVSISLERELNVLLVDADVAKPHISRAFGLGSAPGLIDMLVDETTKFTDVLVRTDINDIQVLPAGRRHPQATELLASDRMSTIVRELAVHYPDRLIILDSPPLLVASEAQALASQVGQIALIVEASRTSEQILTQALETLDQDKAINLVLNKSRHWSGSGASGYYGGDYGYHAYEQG